MDTSRDRLRSFYLLLWGQMASMLGTGLTSFALAVYVYETMGSVTRFALVALAAILPGLLIGPSAGVMVDRWDRRRTILWTDSLAALATLGLAGLYFAQGGLGLGVIFAAVIFFSVLGAFQRPAILSSVPLLVDREQLGRANGALQLIEIVPQIVAPILAGVLLLSIGLGGIMLIDVVTFLIALGTLLKVAIPRPATAPRPPQMLGEIGEAKRFIASHPGLGGLLLVSALTSFAVAMMQITLQPLVLDLASAATLGLVVSLGNVGLLLGSVTMTGWGGPRRKIDGVLVSCALIGVGMLVAGLRPSIPLIILGFFLVTVATPFRNACGVSIWQTKTPPEMMGRVVALRQTVVGLATPIAYALAGPLVDGLFNPWMSEGGRLAASLGPIFGTGPGRGIGLLFVLVAALPLGACLLGYLMPRLRGLEDEVPDAPVGLESAAARTAQAVDLTETGLEGSAA